MVGQDRNPGVTQGGDSVRFGRVSHRLIVTITYRMQPVVRGKQLKRGLRRVVDW